MTSSARAVAVLDRAQRSTTDRRTRRERRSDRASGARRPRRTPRRRAPSRSCRRCDRAIMPHAPRSRRDRPGSRAPHHPRTGRAGARGPPGQDPPRERRSRDGVRRTASSRGPPATPRSDRISSSRRDWPTPIGRHAGAERLECAVVVDAARVKRVVHALEEDVARSEAGGPRRTRTDLVVDRDVGPGHRHAQRRARSCRRWPAFAPVARRGRLVRAEGRRGRQGRLQLILFGERQCLEVPATGDRIRRDTGVRHFSR